MAPGLRGRRVAADANLRLRDLAVGHVILHRSGAVANTGLVLRGGVGVSTQLRRSGGVQAANLGLRDPAVIAVDLGRIGRIARQHPEEEHAGAGLGLGDAVVGAAGLRRLAVLRPTDWSCTTLLPAPSVWVEVATLRSPDWLCIALLSEPRSWVATASLFTPLLADPAWVWTMLLPEPRV